MSDFHWAFYAVFLSQIILVSLYFPRKLLSRVRHVVETYPPMEFPRLYPVAIDKIEQAQRSYRNMNLFALLIGLALALSGILSPSRELLNWDSDMVLTYYLFIQFSPMIVTTTAGFTYFNLMRKKDSRSTRKAELRPRRLFDFISPAVVGLAIFVYVAFVLLVLYIRQFEFPWFGGYANIFGITALNLFFSGIVAQNLYGKRKDPYQANEDRARITEFTVKILVWGSIVATLFVALSITLAALDLRHLQPISLSLYCQLTAAMSFRAFRLDDVNFEVYRDDPLPDQALMATNGC